MRIAAVILDMDGLMVDTEPLYQAAWQKAASESGFEIEDALYARFVGRPTGECEANLREAHGPAFPLPVFQQRWPVLWRDEVERVGIEIKPGLIELLDFIQDAAWPVAVATSSEIAYADLTLRRAGLSDRFGVVVTGDRVERGKPAPDIYLETARQLQVQPSDCVAFEDSEAGILAVARAGMTGILVPHWPASPAAIDAAHHVAATLHEARDVLTSLR